ncbi:hypothetical protein [Salinivibrio proteolyticus]|uniref:Uncharacterized protein n=1 Tax=Salinivibrio proteolyticus TaxID=334715 RepID=A0ABY7LHG3_9GAMM|nr:hypothetical protein [Salinivibrio proteolyticus]WBA16626.1 hypothetical protein N7E60_14695 [Salinivibrio proteolyticus]
MKTYNDKKRIKRHFPMDFYGDGEGWRFAVRAETPQQVLAAKCWVALLSARRREFRIVDLAIECFTYVGSADEGAGHIGADYGTRVSVKRQGQVITVDALTQRYGAIMTVKSRTLSSTCTQPVSGVALS